MPESNVAEEPEAAVLEPDAGAVGMSGRPEADGRGDVPGASVEAATGGHEGVRVSGEGNGAVRPAGSDGASRGNGELVTEIAASVGELVRSSERYHTRAQQRESVIDHLSAEVERLRRGERRGLLRPLLVEMSRLRNDLLRQAGELPADFDAERAALLLRSYAESVELALENSGVVAFAPEDGDAFDPRMHRRVGGEPAADSTLAGRIARVRRDGYLDVDGGSPIAPAEVVVFSAAAGQAGEASQPGRAAAAVRDEQDKRGEQ